MSEGAIPIKYLDDEGECKAREMEYPRHLILDSPEHAKEKEQNPEKMEGDNDIRKNLIGHSYVLVSPLGMMETPSPSGEAKIGEA
jgi:hypothetical protein